MRLDSRPRVEVQTRPPFAPASLMSLTSATNGDLELVITINSGPARLFRSDVGERSRVLRVERIVMASNRDGIGAPSRSPSPEASADRDRRDRVTFWRAGAAHFRPRRSGVVLMHVAWPSGRVDTVTVLRANQSITIQDGVSPGDRLVRRGADRSH